MRLIVLVLGFLVLIVTEILRVYYIMPFPGSQEEETIQIAYWLNNNIIYIRLIGLALIAYPFFYFFNRSNQTIKVILCVVFGFYVVVFYMFNNKYLADKMFLPLKHKVFLDSASNKVLPKQLVIGVIINNESKAYPIEVIGYHHQLRDEVGGQNIMVTYCTVCRTGRVFKPEVDGKEETFRLVGMDHFNAMFEDKTTRSWWRQVNGEAIVGPLKGKMLEEIPSQQMTLSEWIGQHPATTILQPDTVFAEAYKSLSDYDEGKRKGKLERKDSLSWKDKSWIVGVQLGMEARAYDWNELQLLRTVNDVVNGEPILISINSDSVSFHSFNRIVDVDTLSFSLSSNSRNLLDAKTNSLWDWNGRCISGPLLGKALKPVQSYQEYWHSWRTFRPQTTQYKYIPM
jgi:Protein of unknown function (DUF3179)